MSPVRVTLKIAKDGVPLNYQEDDAEFDGIVGHLKDSMAPFILCRLTATAIPAADAPADANPATHPPVCGSSEANRSDAVPPHISRHAR